MSRIPVYPTKALILCLGLVVCAAANPAQAGAQGSLPAQITITTEYAWLRRAPSLTAGNTLPVFKGQFYALIARTADNAWWQLAVPGAEKSTGTWLLADLGVLYSGDLNAVPTISPTLRTGQSAAPNKRTSAAPFPAWIPRITPKQRAFWLASTQHGKILNMFTVAGDCNSEPWAYLRRLAIGEFDASKLEPRLQAIVQRFAPSFGRVSLAARGGFGSGAMMDPTWADGALCGISMGPFPCELWVSRASIVFIGFGTQEQYSWQSFEQNYRALIEHALSKGVLPVLVTKADDIETAAGAPSGYINDVIRKLAKAYDVPLLDFWAATRELPNNGLVDEGNADFHLSAAGMDRRMLVTLQTLAAIVGE